MREILFRGKQVGNGEWAESKCPTATMSCGVERYAFIPETVGQFTGLTDKNGKKIFEGDVVRQTFEKSVPLFASSWGSDEYEDICGDDVGAVVIIPSKGVCIKNPIIHREVDGEVTKHGEKAKMYKPVCCSRCEVIGNIHDNPELLEV